MIKLLINIFILFLLFSCEAPQKEEIEESIKKTKKILKWKPRYHGNKGMILGLKETIDWYITYL